MKNLFLPVLIGLPLVAQTTDVGQVLELTLLRNLRRSPRPYLLVIEDMSKPAAASFRKLLQEDDVADFSLVMRSFQTSKVSNEAMLTYFNAMADAVRKHFKLGTETLWAVVDSKEQCLASGQNVPSAAEFARQLTGAGVQNPIRVLRNFVRANPDHLEARIDLLRLQQQSADQRTRAALGLETATGEASANVLSGEPSGTIRIRTAMRTDASGNLAPAETPKPKPIPKDKELETVLDLQIWGGYAESFDRLLTGDDWIAAGLSFDETDDTPIEICSPLVKGVYRRKIGQAEAALERAPLNAGLWLVWIRMADVIGGRSILAVADRIKQRPGVDFSSWPDVVKSKMIEEARANNRWSNIADYLWADYENAQPVMFGGAVASGSTNPNFNADDFRSRFMDSIWSEQWETLFEPLLEALINMNDLGRADSIMNALQERQRQGQWSETQMQKAIGLANRCNKPDIARRWSAYVRNNNI